MSAALPTGASVRVARPDALPPAGERFVVVEASAGTGKTFFLEHRVVDLILGAGPELDGASGRPRPGAELGQILLVTFTEKAVAELRMRIRDLLDRLSRATANSADPGASAWTIDDAARTALRAAVTAFDRAPIFTIHGFCHRILIEDAFAARRVFDQVQVADEVAFDAAFAALLRERFARAEPERELLAAFLESGQTVDALRDLLLGCARTNAHARRHLDPEAALADAAALVAGFAPAARAAMFDSLPRNGNERRWMTGWFDAIGLAIDHADTAHRPLTAPRALALIDALREPVGNLAKYAARERERVPELLGLVQTAAGSLPLAEAIAAEMLPRVLERIAADKAEHGQFDYDDMLRLVRDALAGTRGAELAARLRARTPWVMIDEFQDTDATQWQIFREVWMHADARGLTIVGDPKQAIYGFRGADVQTYLAAKAELQRAGATTVPLIVNRRSTPQLVAAVNHVLVGNLAMPLMTGDITYDAPVAASGDVTCDEARAPITVFALRGAGGKEASWLALATAIGEEVERLRAAPPPWQRRGSAPPFSLADVMILTRGHRESAAVARALRGRGLPCTLVESDKLFQTREAHELATVLAAIAAPRDRAARLRALRTRFFDVPWPDLARVVDAPDHHPLIARLFDWAGLAARRGYETLFRRLVEDSRYAERALIAGSGERAITNTWHLLELLLGEVARARCDLHELVGQLRRWIADGADRFDDLDVQRAETDADAIRILTIHKAKGLEAPYVFVFGGTSRPPSSRVHALRDPLGRRLVVDAQDEATTEGIAAQAEGENQRLAYVALTRAQVRLYLPRYGDKVVQDRAMYQCIQRCLANVDRTPGFAVVPVAVGADEREPAPADALAGFVAAPAPALGEPPAIDGTRGGLAMLSYTRLAHDVHDATRSDRSGASQRMPASAGDAPLAIDAQEFDVDDSTEPPGELAPGDLPPGAASGLLLHHVLEHADLELARGARDVGAWMAHREVAAQLDEGARLHGIDARHLPHAAQLAHATLTAPLQLTDRATLPPLVDATALAREVEFTFPLPTQARGAPVPGLVKGYIDALVAWDDELWVLDYKSDLLGGPDLAAAATARAHDRYGVQMRLYALAAARMCGRRRLAGLLFAFVRHGQCVPVRVDDATLDSWTAWLAALRVQPREARA